MFSDILMKLFLLGYVLCAIASCFEGNYHRALYWVGASVITIAVLWGTGT